MADISGNWNKNMPSGTSLISEGDDLMRQHWGSIQSLVQDEHYFNDSLSSAGIHKPGSARIFVGPSSAMSAVGATTDDGRLYLEEDTGNLMHVGQAVTRANYGGGVCLATDYTDSNPVLGDIIGGGTNDDARYASIAAEWGPASGDTWGIVSNSSIKYVTVPSNLSGYFAVNFNTQLAEGAAIYGTGAHHVFINVQKNGLSVYTADYGDNSSDITTFNINLNYILAAKSGDSIRVRAWHDDQAAGTSGTNQLSIFKVG